MGFFQMKIIFYKSNDVGEKINWSKKMHLVIFLKIKVIYIYIVENKIQLITKSIKYVYNNTYIYKDQ